MGLFVNLYVNFDAGITQNDWNSIYEESLTLLKMFPVELIRLTSEEIEGHKRYVLSKQISEDIGKNSENWRISGDLRTFKQAEVFEFFRFEAESHSSENSVNRNRDILFASEDSLHYNDCCGEELFGSKTQGYPYHLAVLAVAILVENRLGEKAFVSGDITMTACKAVTNWMNGILKKPVKLPLAVTGQRLWDRIYPMYGDINNVITRFEALYRGDNITQTEIILKNCKKSDVEKIIKEKIEKYESLDQYGASNIIEQTLAVTQDIKRLIEILFIPKESAKYTLEDLLELICSKFVTIPLKNRELLSLFSMDGSKLNTIEDHFSSLFSMFSEKPSDINYFIEQDRLIEIFSSFDPSKKDIFKDITIKWNKKNEKFLDTLKEKMQKDRGSFDEEVEKIHSDKDGFSKKEENGEDYIIKTITSELPSYTKDHKNAEVIATSIGNTAVKNFDYLKDEFDSLSRKLMLFAIIDMCKRNIALSEAAWENIDNERDLKILKALFILVSFKKNEINFLKWRIHALETKELWPLLASKLQ